MKLTTPPYSSLERVMNPIIAGITIPDS